MNINNKYYDVVIENHHFHVVDNLNKPTKQFRLITIGLVF